MSTALTVVPELDALRRELDVAYGLDDIPQNDAEKVRNIAEEHNLSYYKECLSRLQEEARDGKFHRQFPRNFEASREKLEVLMGHLMDNGFTVELQRAGWFPAKWILDIKWK